MYLIYILVYINVFNNPNAMVYNCEHLMCIILSYVLALSLLSYVLVLSLN